MKNKWTKIILSCIMLFALSNEYCIAQTNDVFKPTIIDFYNQLKFQTALTENEADNITGSPYLDSSFHQGYILTSDSLIYQGVNMRYNNYKDVVEFKKNGQDIYEIPISFPILQLKFEGIIFERKEYKTEGKLKYGFFQPILKGKTSLYSQQRVILEKAKLASLYNESKLAHFKITPSKYYLQKNKDKELVSFSNKKELLSILNDNENKLSTFIKKNKLKVKDEQDILQVLDYYNSISE